MVAVVAAMRYRHDHHCPWCHCWVECEDPDCLYGEREIEVVCADCEYIHLDKPDQDAQVLRYAWAAQQLGFVV